MKCKSCETDIDNRGECPWGCNQDDEIEATSSVENRIQRLEELVADYERDKRIIGEALGLSDAAAMEHQSQLNAIKRDRKEIDDLISQRDFWEERATKLAEAIGQHFGQDFGEHSSWNDPTAEALEFLG